LPERVRNLRGFLDHEGRLPAVGQLPADLLYGPDLVIGVESTHPIVPAPALGHDLGYPPERGEPEGPTYLRGLKRVHPDHDYIRTDTSGPGYCIDAELPRIGEPNLDL
jgi:hypothetical protein